MENEETSLGDPGENSATGGTQTTDDTPAGGKDNGADAGAPNSQADPDDERERGKSALALLEALHDPESAPMALAVLKEGLKAKGMDLADLVGTKEAAKIEQKVEALDTSIDLSDLKFDNEGVFDGTEKELLQSIATKVGGALRPLLERVASLESALGQHSELAKTLQPVADRERQKAETRNAINLHGGYVKATVLKEYGVNVNNQDIENALHKSPSAKGHRDLIVAAVVAMKTRKEPAKPGPELLGNGTGAERKDHANELDSVVKNVVANLNSGR